jgi:Spy/CpxP family protein refolding chaperone
MNPQNKMLLKIWSGVVVVFVLGCVTGAAIDGLYRSSVEKDQQALSIRETNQYFETLKREVNLTPEQVEKMGAILDQMRNNYKSVCAEVKPRYYSVREDARIKMRALLTPEQQQNFDKIVTQDDCKCPETPK